MSNLLQAPNGFDQIVNLLGDPRPYIQPDGTMSPEWESSMLVTIPLPFTLPLDWNRSTTVNRMRCHKFLADAFSETFQAIVDEGLKDCVKTFGGCYMPRAQRGSLSIPSLHLWAAAVDLNPFENKQGTKGNMDPRLVSLFARQGFYWGGNFSGERQDPMHFQFATGY